MAGPSFPKLVVVCNFCKKSFDLLDLQYHGYYSGQINFHCSKNCKKENSKCNALARIEPDYVPVSNTDRQTLKFNNMLRRVKELEQFRFDNRVEIEKLKASVERVNHDGGRSDEIVKLRLSGMILSEIGAKFGITRERVRQLLVNRGCIYKPPKKPKKPPLMYDLVCVECEKSYQKVYKSKYCSSKCRSVKSVASKNKFRKLICAGCSCGFERSDYLLNIAKHGKIGRGYDPKDRKSVV